MAEYDAGVVDVNQAPHFLHHCRHIRLAVTRRIFTMSSTSSLSVANSATDILNLAAKEMLNSSGARLQPWRNPSSTSDSQSIRRHPSSHALSDAVVRLADDHQHHERHAGAFQDGQKWLAADGVVVVGEVDKSRVERAALRCCHFVETPGDEHNVVDRPYRVEAMLLLETDVLALGVRSIASGA